MLCGARGALKGARVCLPQFRVFSCCCVVPAPGGVLPREEAPGAGVWCSCGRAVCRAAGAAGHRQEPASAWAGEWGPAAGAHQRGGLQEGFGEFPAVSREQYLGLGEGQILEGAAALPRYTGRETAASPLLY